MHHHVWLVSSSNFMLWHMDLSYGRKLRQEDWLSSGNRGQSEYYEQNVLNPSQPNLPLELWLQSEMFGIRSVVYKHLEKHN